MSRIIKKENVEQTVQEYPARQTGAPVDAGVRPFEARRVVIHEDGTLTVLPSPGVSAAESGNAAPGGGASSEESEQGKEQPPIDVDQIRRLAFEEGFGKGEKSGEEKARTRFEQAIASFSGTVRELALLKPGLRREAERELVELSFAIARRVLRRELNADPAAVLGIIRACLEEFEQAEMKQLKVNPADFDAVKAYWDSHPLPNVELVSDPAVGPGGAVFETQQGCLDASIDTQLQEIEYGLADG